MAERAREQSSADHSEVFDLRAALSGFSASQKWDFRTAGPEIRAIQRRLFEPTLTDEAVVEAAADVAARTAALGERAPLAAPPGQTMMLSAHALLTGHFERARAFLDDPGASRALALGVLAWSTLGALMLAAAHAPQNNLEDPEPASDTVQADAPQRITEAFFLAMTVIEQADLAAVERRERCRELALRAGEQAVSGVLALIETHLEGLYGRLGVTTGPRGALQERMRTWNTWVFLKPWTAFWLVERVLGETDVEVMHASSALIGECGSDAIGPVVDRLNRDLTPEAALTLLWGAKLIDVHADPDIVGRCEAALRRWLAHGDEDVRRAAAGATAALLPEAQRRELLTAALRSEQDSEVRDVLHAALTR